MKTYTRRRYREKCKTNDIDLGEICRLCLSTSGDRRRIFSDTEEIPLAVKIMACTTLEVFDGDGLPGEICLHCIQQLENFYNFRQTCIEANKKLCSIAHISKEKNLDPKNNSDTLYEGNERSGGLQNEAIIDSLSESLSVKENNGYNAYLNKDSPQEEPTFMNNMLVNPQSDTPIPSLQCHTISSEHCELPNIEYCELKTNTFLVSENVSSCTDLDFGETHNDCGEQGTGSNNCFPNGKSEPYPGSIGLESDRINVSSNNQQRIASERVKKLSVHNSATPFVCDKCPKMFSKRADMKRHSSVHDQQRGFVCGECEKWFPNKTSFKRHERIHTGERPFGCKHCNKHFSQESILSRHMITHSEQKPFHCDICSKSFTQRFALRIHLRRHDLEMQEVRNYPCPLCEKTFRHSSGLSRHVIVHTGKTFDCSVCSKSYTDQSSLKRHVKMHRKKEKAT